MSLHRFTQYFIYSLKAKNRHGIHSPFVYNLLDRCLLINTHQPLFQRLENYFGKDNLLQTADPGKLNAHNVIYISGIHETSEATNSWNKLRSDKEVLLSIDLFHLGLLISRPEFKEKQHFILKTK